jgi:tRNA modification GTPase
VGQSTTIAAIATGPARGGIGVVRLSGPLALEAARSVAPLLPLTPVPRHAYFLGFTNRSGERIDEGLALYFQAPASFTGEEVLELHAHGAPRLLQLLLEAVVAHPGVRIAEAGEFTRRAFLNGRIDLTRAEAVADLVAADSEAAIRAAAAQLAGGLSAQLKSVRAPLVALRADLEAALDFPDESEGIESAASQRLASVLESVRALTNSGRQGALIRRGAQVVLYGPVNSGKSTLFNRLVGVDRALVDETPGTTRDVLEARLEWDGLQVALFDTAGLRNAPERLEARGIERTRAALKGADLAVLLLPPSAGADELTRWREDAREVARLEVVGKADLHPTPPGTLGVSGQSGAGVEQLRARILESLGYRRAEAVALSSTRHLEALERATDALERAASALEVSTLEVVAGEVGAADVALSEVTGEDARGELLDAIFQRFCIGK